MSANNFRLSAKSLFLTYPQCPLEPQVVLDELKQILIFHDIIRWTVARENHSDGQPHIHCAIRLRHKFDSRTPNCLDVQGYHGNYQGSRNFSLVWNYCRKHQNYISSDKSLLQSVQHCNSRKDLIELCVEQELIGKYNVLEKYHNLVRGYTNPQPIMPFDWYRAIPSPVSGSAIWLSGSPGIGKTIYTRYKYPKAFFVDGPKHFQHYDGENQLVFADFRISNWENEFSFIRKAITDEVCWTPPYYGSFRLPWPRTVIVETNERLRQLTQRDEAMTRRFTEVYLDDIIEPTCHQPEIIDE